MSEADQLLSGRTPFSADYDAAESRVCVKVTRRPSIENSEYICANTEKAQGPGADEKSKERENGVCGTIRGWSARQRIMLLAMAVAEAAGFAALSVIAPLFPPLVIRDLELPNDI